MILRALFDFAEREGLLVDPSYEPKPVDFLIHLGPGGKYLGVVSSPREAPSLDSKGKPKGIPKARQRPIPRRSDRTVQNQPEFLVDKAEYALGIDPSIGKKRDSLKLSQRRQMFREYVEEAGRHIPDSEGLSAVAKFLASDVPAEINSLLEGSAPGLKPEQLPGALFAFVYDPDGGTRCVHDEPKVMDWFRRRIENPEGKERGQCLVTGEVNAVLTRLHAKPKGIPPLGTTKGGVPLTTVNQDSFKSYGLDHLGGAPISERANLGIESALARLLAPNYPGPNGSPLPRRCIPIGSDSILVYWARQNASLDFFAAIDTEDPEAVARMVRSATGPNPAPIDDPTAFYALILSGKQGRAIVRSFVESTVRDVARSVELYREEGCIIRPYATEPGGYSLRDILVSLVPRGELKHLPPALGAALYVSIVLGRRFPGRILESVVRRNRSELFGKTPKGGPDAKPLAARLSLLKAWFHRNRGKEISVSLDPDRTEVAYRLGRLLATLDKVQADALGHVNATLVDRYFGSASSTPAAVFPTLIRRSQNHLSKLRREKRGLAITRERMLQEIVGALVNFPKTLNLEDQGLFAIGFYHQRQDFFTKKEDN